LYLPTSQPEFIPAVSGRYVGIRTHNIMFLSGT